MPHPNQALAAFFDKFLSGRVGNTLALTGRLEREVLRSLCDGVPTLAELAKRMGLSTRTLQRQLAAEHASLRGIVDSVRRSAALQHVANNMA